MATDSENLSVASIQFGKRFFPSQTNGKLNTIEFLEASRGVVTLMDRLGKIFSPLTSDISNNIEKIKKCYDKNPTEYLFIEDMILSEKSKNNELSIDALLWLRRALHFVLVFFQNILNDVKKNECLQEHLASAYSQTLEPYHGFITRKLFQFFKNLVPKRSDLFRIIFGDNKEVDMDQWIVLLQSYIQSLSENVHHLMSFYKEHNLNSNAKV